MFQCNVTASSSGNTGWIDDWGIIYVDEGDMVNIVYYNETHTS
jgi:hypothetical protein